MNRRPYFSVRTGRHTDGLNFGLPMLQRLLRDLYLSLAERGYLQEAFGYYCVDAGQVAGYLGSDIEAQLLLSLRKSDLWPIEDKITGFSEDDCFDVIEFLYDCVSKPIETPGAYHSFSNCGWHYSRFDRENGQQEFRQGANSILQDYATGWELSKEGEILAVADEGLQPLLDAELPEYDPDSVEKRVLAAIRKFRSRGSSIEDRRDAVRDLADVLEFLRPKANECLLTKKDDAALFRIANEFAIRHHDGRQKGNYSIAIWYSWVFYFYLATIHAAVRAIGEAERQRIS